MGLTLKHCLSGLMVGMLAAGALRAETSVTVTGAHLCCKACLKAVDGALSKVEGVQHESDQQKKTISITASDREVAQKAVDALAAAGFHGKLDNKELRFKPVKAPKGNVSRLALTGIHNCCAGCTKAIQGALAKVSGVEANTVKPKESSFVLEGDFSAAEAIEALFGAGFHAVVKQ